MVKLNPIPSKISDVVQENKWARSFVLKVSDIKEATPGQFIMVWIPGLTELPVIPSFTKSKKGQIGITVKKRLPTPSMCEICNVCKWCDEMYELKQGDIVGVRGPFGRGFDLLGEKIAIIGSDIRIAPLLPLVKKGLEWGQDVTAIIGAPSADGLLFEKQMKEMGAEVVIATGDGSTGIKGGVEIALRKMLDAGREFDYVSIYSTEKTMKKVMKITEKYAIPTQVRVERHIVCGVGICGTCCIDPYGWRVCTEGPIFWARELKKTEFGKYRRDAATRKISIK